MIKKPLKAASNNSTQVKLMQMEAPSLVRKHLRIRGVAGKLTRRVLARFHMTRVEFQILTKTLKLQMAHKLK